MFRQETSIFRKILLPLIFLVCVQALILWITILASGTLDKIDASSVNIMEQTAENRRLILENNMVQHWSNLSEEVGRINGQMRELMRSGQVTMEEFLADKELQQDFLLEITDSASFTIRKNLVNGSFVVFANQELIDTGSSKLVGIYFRDLDPTSTPTDYSDILMERGDARFAQKFGIPFDSLWTSQFTVSSDSQDGSQDYFMKPFSAASQLGDIGFQNLGYWSSPFYLNGENGNDSYEMITYSVPLMINGKVYGVMGVDISLQYLSGLLPSRELGYQNSESGYMLLVQDGELDSQQGFVVNLATGSISHSVTDQTRTVYLEADTGYDSFYEISGLNSKRGQLCGTLHPLKLYNSNTPFSNQQWYLMAVSDKEQMFMLSRELLTHLMLNAFLYVGLGVLSVYIIAAMVTKPIRKLVACIKGSRENKMADYSRGDIREINELFDVVEDLTKKQKLSEDALLEEKDRYQAALESSTAALFEYDAVNDSLCLYNFISNRSKRLIPLKIYANWKQKIKDPAFVCEEDRDQIEEVFTQVSDYKKCAFRVNLDNGKDGFSWTQLQGKTIYDSSHRVVKIIGSFRDIQEEKQRQIKEEEAQRKDLLTNLNNRREGIRQIQNSLHKVQAGCLLLFDIDRFQEINDNLGRVVGDVVLEEIGKILEQLSGPEDVTLRYGGDEFAVWFPGQPGSQVENFYSILSWHLMVCNELSSLEVRINAGYTEIDETQQFSVQQIFQRALLAMIFGKKNGGTGIIKYSMIPEEDQMVEIKESDVTREDSVFNYNNPASITSLAFNMFEKSEDFKKILPILFLKVGRYYRFSDIVMIQMDRSFYTNYISGQWHRDNNYVTEQVYRYTEQVFKDCEEAISTGQLEFSDASEDLSQEQRDYFKIRESTAGFCYPIVIGSVLFGSISFMTDQLIDFDQNLKNSLEEVVKIIATNLGKARSDLASKAKSDFLSRMSHEIRTPMNAIIGMAEIARRHPGLPEDTALCLKKIDSSSQYLLSIINDILDMSRIESGKMKLALAPLDVNRLLEDVDTLIRPQAEVRKLNFVIRQEEMICTQLIGDGMRLNQILINLLGNALKFTPEDGTITLVIKQSRINEERLSVYFAVEDTGIGINQDNQERIFHAFEQEENTTATQYGGTGLGLAISNNLVKMMGGTLELTSEVGKGSRFFFTISCNISKEVLEEKKQSSDMVYDFTGKRILLVEDNELNTEIAKTLLEVDGFCIDTAENGQIAVDKFVASELNSYDAILMDIRMPVMDGLEATITIRNSMRADSRTVPIVAMSANAFDEDMKKSIESGMNGHLVKPLDMKKLHELLGSIFASRKQ